MKNIDATKYQATYETVDGDEIEIEFVQIVRQGDGWNYDDEVVGRAEETYFINGEEADEDTAKNLVGERRLELMRGNAKEVKPYSFR